jgi:hypothetical protein
MLEKMKASAQWVFLLLTTFIVLAWRRPDQLLHPYVWVEEGTVTLVDYIHHGWLSFFYPVAGYLVLPSKVIFLIAASISMRHLPNIEYWLTVLFTFGVVACIAKAPTVLRWRYACALAVLFLPLNPEVFAVSEYAFWWGTILAFLVLLWDLQDEGYLRSRLGLLIVGGFSSPMIIPIAGFMVVRAMVQRKRVDVALAVTSAVIAGVQMWVMHATAAHSTIPDIEPFLMVRKFFGFFVAQGPMATDDVVLTCGVLLLLLTSLFAIRRWRDPGTWLLLVCLGMSIAASVARAPMAAIHPLLAGPRYFFYPFLLFAWLLIQMAAEKGQKSRWIAMASLACALVICVTYGQRRNDRMDWSANLRACAASETYAMPIQFDGNKSNPWHVMLTGEQCKELAK